MALPTTDTELCNIALGHLGITTRIDDLATDDTKEATVCRANYELIRDEVLTDALWPEARKIATLGLVEEDPNDEWSFSYTYPSDCLHPRRILSGARTDSMDTVIPFQIGNDAGAILIYTDTEDAELEYTMRLTTVSLMSALFIQAFTYKFAGSIAPSFSTEQQSLGNRALQMYQVQIAKAAAKAENKPRYDSEADSEFIRGR